MRARALALWLGVVASGVLAVSSSADYLEVRRASFLKDRPESGANSLLHFAGGEHLRLIEADQTDGYYHAEPYGGGQAGWIYRTLVRRWPGDPENVVPEPGSGGGPSTPSEPATNGDDASAFPIPNCAPEGNPSPNGALYEKYQALNRLKNRMHGPTDAQVQQMNIDAFLAPGDDETRWTTDMAVELVGWVSDVKPGGKETCNCSADAAHRDTHIELTRGPDDHGLPMIVEVTPEWRELMASRGKDWSTDALSSSILHHYVRVRGWLLQDWQHQGESENTASNGGEDSWRQTSWELHPITSLELIPTP